MVTLKEQLPIDPSLNGGDNLIRLIDYSYPDIATIINLTDYIFDNIQEHIIEPDVANTSIRVTAKETALFRGSKTLYYKRFNLESIDGSEWIIPEIADVPATPDAALDFLITKVGLVKEELVIEEMARYTYSIKAIDNAYTVYNNAVIIIPPLDTRIPLDEIIDKLMVNGLNYPEEAPMVDLTSEMGGPLYGFERK